MRVALVQTNPLVGDLEGNAKGILERSREAAAGGAELAVFPELAVPGYPPQDLLDEPGFVSRCIEASTGLVERLGAELPDLAVVFGTVRRRASSRGKLLANSVVLAAGGRSLAVRDKTLLPTYDVFDENRWFDASRSNTPVGWKGLRLGLTICEDVWNDELFWGRRVYDRDPVEELAESGSDVLLNISASPYHRGKARGREEMLAATARRHGVAIVFVNQVGGQDELIFDGASALIDAGGRVLARCARFREDLVVVELPEGAPDEELPGAGPEPLAEGAVRDLRQALGLGLRDYVAKCGFRDVVLGLSGGIDSAVVAALAAEALGPERVEGVLMPSRFSSESSVRDALELARGLGIRTRTLPIEPAHAAFLSMLEESFRGLPTDVTEENLQARVRGTLLMALSNKLGSLVLSTGNKSELAIGYCTLYGDMNGGLSVLGDCWKGWVRELAASFHADGELIPRAILEKAPSAELAPNQRDSDSLPPYELLDRVLEGLVERQASPAELVAEGLDEELIRRVKGLLDRNEYKRRQAPPVLRVTRKAFGPGRRLPLARG